ncbi:TRAP transporter large permease subunit [Bradyrhizobium sp. LHD-71]|uniref:TRAP transporter large permease n=1 Tax=Bradyrhizobium sp. LHD-71 TaxID=3072141 RepID=UPI00280DBEEA|nr:TRAP transporter large permease subunit [Bradyrhizobium sp. LHD-71]MDQ8728971.1 TRAP transporter large permease subunit [Bradyrhizobium sp. LHD-71]
MSGIELLAILLVVLVCGTLMAGYPAALTLGGMSLAVALAADAFGLFPISLLHAVPSRIYGVITSETLMAIPLFIFMGVTLERSRVAEDLLEQLARMLGNWRGGLGIAVLFVGLLLAAAKGVVGATTVTMGLIVLPTMLRHGYDPRLAAGTVAATSTLAQVFPPATVLVLLGDQIGNAWQSAQLASGVFAPQPVTVTDLFAGAIVPGFLLVALYLAYLVAVAWLKPAWSPAIPADILGRKHAAPTLLLRALIAPLALIAIVLGSILGGFATPTEAAAVGAVGALVLAVWRSGLSNELLTSVVGRTAQMSSMIFLILIGATMFSLVFRGLGGDDLVHRALSQLPGGPAGAVLVVMLAVFLLGFVMDAFEIIVVIVPIVAVPLLAMPGIDPVWLGVLLAVNLQTSYMHPPLGPTVFYLRSVAPPELTTRHIYLGVVPFIAIQLLALVALWFAPQLATALPQALYGAR